MKKLNIAIISLLMLASLSVKAQTQMQIEFEKFLDLFPTITWNQMQEVTLDDSIIANTCKEIPYEQIRRNMWYEEPQNGPKNVYNHIRNEIKSVDYDYATPPPHIIDVDGDYIHYEKVGGYDNVYAVGKMKISDDIIMIVLCSLSEKNKTRAEGWGSRQLYTFKKSTQQMISAYETESDKAKCNFLKDYSFVVFENYGWIEMDDERPTDARYTHRKFVKLLPNGYFSETEIQTGIYLYYGSVQDSDGYANVRKSPDIKSEILYQVKDSSYIEAYGEPDAKWFEVSVVIDPLQSIHSVDKKQGYIHRSRLKDIERWRKSLRNTDIKE